MTKRTEQAPQQGASEAFTFHPHGDQTVADLGNEMVRAFQQNPHLMHHLRVVDRQMVDDLARNGWLVEDYDKNGILYYVCADGRILHQTEKLVQGEVVYGVDVSPLPEKMLLVFERPLNVELARKRVHPQVRVLGAPSDFKGCFPVGWYGDRELSKVMAAFELANNLTRAEGRLVTPDMLIAPYVVDRT